MQERTPQFFVTGGTLRPDAGCYIEREADTSLFTALSAGELCYVLTSRQTGKSSLMIRTAVRLRSTGACAVVLDLTMIGQQLTPEQWYRSLIDVLGEQLALEDELEQYWETHRHVGNARRWLNAICEMALPRCPKGLTLFIDEVDAVLALPFKVDEFFAAIRGLYNQRAAERGLSRLNFCLLGVAAPSDLISDPHTTPFNVGRRIELADFTEAEALPFASGLVSGKGLKGQEEARARALLHRVLYWTGGHPYLTQRLCLQVAADVAIWRSSEARGRSLRSSTVPQRDLVDRACRSLFLAPGALRGDEHLLFIQERLLRTGPDRAAVLELYQRLQSGGTLDDREDQVQEFLRLAGVVRSVAGRLRLRNRLYARVFDREWVRTVAEEVPKELG